jgi:signal peptidase I
MKNFSKLLPHTTKQMPTIICILFIGFIAVTCNNAFAIKVNKDSEKSKIKDQDNSGNPYKYKMMVSTMENTIKANDMLDIDKNLINLKRGDIIVYKLEANPGTNLIQRIIGIPGDTVHTVDKVLFINDERIDNEVYAVHKESDIIPQAQNPRDNNDPYLVKDNEFYVMGDNRDRSYDSRFMGGISINQIVGKVVKINGMKVK